MLRPVTRCALGVFLAAATLSLAACGGAAPAPTAAPKAETKPAASPATAASPAPGASPSPAALGPSASGEVDAVEGRLLSVATSTGVRRVRVAENATVLQEGQGTLTDLVSGAMVGVTGRPDGTAVIVRFFPPGISPKPGQFPMTGAQAGNIMTNATIVSFDGTALVVDLGGERVTLTVPADAQIIKPLPATFAEIKPGVRLFASGTPEGDVLVAQTVTVVSPPR
jgi:hypothetical protein